jgi:hypothetical protein
MTKKIFLQNKYSKCYFRIIEVAKNRKLDIEYIEKHHVLPKSLGGDNSKENIVEITAKEHFICHLLLPKSVFPEYKKKMNYAFWRMCNATGKRYKPSARLYEMGKREFSNSHLGHISYNLNQSDESRKKISIGMKETLSKLSVEEIKIEC